MRLPRRWHIVVRVTAASRLLLSFIGCSRFIVLLVSPYVSYVAACSRAIASPVLHASPWEMNVAIPACNAFDLF